MVDYFRKRRVHTQYAEYTDADLHEIADDTAPDNELLEQLADALSALGQKERDLIVLH